MNPFEKALGRIAETVSLVSQYDGFALEQALNDGRGRLAIAVGSGPFLAVAHYFARCRATLGLGASLVMTPMEFILNLQDWGNAEIWLFSADADSPDTRAAFRSAAARSSQAVRSMTTYRIGNATASHGGDSIVVPVVDSNDGLLSVNAMDAMVSALLFASDRLTERPLRAALADKLTSAMQTKPRSPNRPTSGFNVGDTVVLLHDPQLMPIASMMEAYLWQTGIAPVQRSDFREFACNRYKWSSLHSGSTFLLALTTCESEFIWDGLREAMPPGSRNQTINCGDGGRFANASGMLTGQAVLSQMLCVVDRAAALQASIPSDEVACDPRALQELDACLTPAVRHKAIARQLHDPIFDESNSLGILGKRRLHALETARFVGIALDYDGTVVSNEPPEARLGPPPRAVIDQLVRLADNGILVGIATGRGSSAGAKLREALPKRLHAEFLIGYFNGACIRTLDVDISTDQPRRHSRITEVADWVASSQLLRTGAHIYSGSFQVTVRLGQIVDPRNFVEQMAACPAVAIGDMRLVRSRHTFDIIPAETTKLAVIHSLAQRASGQDAHILAIGDSGSPLGNDRQLLLRPHAISVDRVCGDCNGTWSLFGHGVRGPAALLRILQSIRVKNGSALIDVESLGLS